jgi:hypothetical protein
MFVGASAAEFGFTLLVVAPLVNDWVRSKCSDGKLQCCRPLHAGLANVGCKQLMSYGLLSFQTRCSTLTTEQPTFTTNS